MHIVTFGTKAQLQLQMMSMNGLMQPIVTCAVWPVFQCATGAVTLCFWHVAVLCHSRPKQTTAIWTVVAMSNGNPSQSTQVKQSLSCCLKQLALDVAD